MPIRLHRVASGPVRLTISAPGFVSKTYATVPTFMIEGMPATQMGDRVYAIKQVDDAGEVFGQGTNTDMTLTTSPNLQMLTDAVSLTPISAVTIPAGQGLVLAIGHQLAPGAASLTITAPGFASRAFNTTLVQPVVRTFAIANWPTRLTGDLTLDIRTVGDGASFGVSELTTVTFTLSSNATMLDSNGDVLPTAFYRPTQGAIFPVLRRLGLGPITLTVSAPGWTSVTYTLPDG
jgi:hypothetical protein